MAAKPPTVRYPLEQKPDGRPRFQGCAKIQEYEYLCKLGEGTFGEVSKAKSKKTGQVVALKKILVHNEKDGFPITALREIKLLKQLNHPNVLKLVEMAVERPKDITKKSNMFMATPYMDHDLSGLLKNQNIKFSEAQIKCYMKQLLQGCKYLHEARILHRDMKAANLLISNKGILQIADFGLARPYDDAPPQPGKGGGEATRNYTTLVVTRWYRPPELLLQLRNYTTAVDMWGVGCVFGEMFKRRPILQGDSDLKQAHLIFQLVGSPNDETMPGWSELPGCEGVKDFGNERGTLHHQFRDLKPAALSLLQQFLTLDWRKRINAMDALEHPYFKTEPLPARPEDLPIMEDSHEFDKQRQREDRKPPPAPAGGAVGIGPPNEYGFEARRPHDHRGRPPDRRPYPNGGHGRGPPRNGDHDHRGHRGPREHGPHDRDRDYRHPRNYDEPPYDRDRDRRPPMHRDPPSYDDTHPSRRPHLPPDTSLPPRPPGQDDAYINGGPAPYRDRDREEGPGGPPSRVPMRPNRVPPPGVESGPPRVPARQQPEVDTYIPSYSNADPSARPPRFPEAGGNPNQRRRPPPRDPDARPGSRSGRGPSADFDDVLRYDDGAGPSGGRGPPSAESYERRRSRSPMRMDRGPDRDRDPYYGRGGSGGQQQDYYGR